MFSVILFKCDMNLRTLALPCVFASLLETCLSESIAVLQISCYEDAPLEASGFACYFVPIVGILALVCK